MKIGIWVLGDQLWHGQAAITTAAENTPIIIIESLAHIQQRPYHQQKLVLVWSAMRHFAAELRAEGKPVTYYEGAANFTTPLSEWVNLHAIEELRVMAPNDRPFLDLINHLQLPGKITIIPNNQFLWSEPEFKQWVSGRKRLLMEDFYREGRRRFNILMEANKPIGGNWNFDKENRQPPKGQLYPPEPLWSEPDAITQAVISQVKSLHHIPMYGTAEPFRWGVTREQALAALQYFISECLPDFGPYQDAMVTGQETMWHSLISPYLNIGLLHPLEVIKAAEIAYHQRQLNLNSVEGFIRQILGWREYMHGVYLLVDADYAGGNWFNHHHPLPDFFWDARQTDMNCLHQVLSQVERTGYAHHIQRLMVLSNFALIAGLSPQAVESWFHSAFIDAYDWVMQTNVIGMGLFADGGMLASKPYAASANYLHKMSDYCGNCVYNYKQRTGSKACPFNFFYWDFLDRHRERLEKQGRISFILKNLDRMSEAELQEIRRLARDWHDDGE